MKKEHNLPLKVTSLTASLPICTLGKFLHHERVLRTLEKPKVSSLRFQLLDTAPISLCNTGTFVPPWQSNFVMGKEEKYLSISSKEQDRTLKTII